MNWADYQVGRRVVCIKAKWWGNPVCRANAARGFDFPRVGIVYTICLVEPFRGGIYLGFQELPTPKKNFDMFAAECFRPLDERRLDQFRQLLTPAPKVRASA
jgi:hypothetical protein